MKVVVLAGGMGTRLREETEFRPKPMVEVGGRPVLWHIMKNCAAQGFVDFVICVGYKGELIKDYFLNYEARNCDFTVTLGRNESTKYYENHSESDWKVTVVDTGLHTMTGGRVKRASPYLGNEPFMVVYGDGLANVNLKDLSAFHESHGGLATVTTVRQPSRFGILDVNQDHRVVSFKEKPLTDTYVNAGFFIFEPKVIDYLDFNCVLEQEPLQALASNGELFAYRHEGFWQPMDTYRELLMLNEIWESETVPWKVWES
jgi:glucose-1-phosphate cytidylyltransferase